jgi:hypothetical protein
LPHISNGCIIRAWEAVALAQELQICSRPRRLEKLPPSGTPSARHVLPTDLPNAIKHLSDHELERLVAVALGEQKRRGGKSDPLSDKRRVELAGVTLTPSKMNAVRAAL